MCISGTGTFTPEDAFVGYQSDTPASVVFKVWQDLELSNVELDEDSEQWEEEVMFCVYPLTIHAYSNKDPNWK